MKTADYKEIIKSIEAKGYTEADIASYVEATTKSIQYWKNGQHSPKGGKLRKLLEMISLENKSSREDFGSLPLYDPPARYSKSDRIKMDNEDMAITILRIQNAVMNIEAKVDANSKMLKLILEMVNAKSGENANSIYNTFLNESLSSRLEGQDITHKNIEK